MSTVGALNALISDNDLFYSQYTCTDSSLEALTTAQKTLKSYQHIDYKTLDITIDPIKQGFQAHGYDLVIASNVMHYVSDPKSALQNIKTLLVSDGRLFVQDVSSSLDEKRFAAFKGFVSSSPRILWVTQSLQVGCDDPRYGLVLGVSRTIRQELGHYFGTFEIDCFDNNAIISLVKVYEKFARQYERKDSADLDYEFALHDGTIYIGRFRWSSLTDKLLKIPDPGSPAKLSIRSYGSLDSLYWTPDRISILGPDDLEVDIKYVGLNFRDIMIALGVMADEREFGMEASGIVRKFGKMIEIGKRDILEHGMLSMDLFGVKGDVASLTDVERAVSMSPRPIGGVLQVSMVMRDQFIPGMTYDSWQAALLPKVDGTWNLHKALRHEPLQFLVVFGSIAGVMGHEGQMNYAAANTFLNSFVQYRRAKGLPASIINLGCVDEVGYLATENTRLRDSMRSASVSLLSEENVLDALELAICQQSYPNTVSTEQMLTPGECTVGMSNSRCRSDPSVRQMWGPDARFRAYANLEAHMTNRHAAGAVEILRERLSSIEHSPDILDDPCVRDQIMKDIIDATRNFTSFGQGLDHEQLMQMQIDSLMTFEIRNWNRRHLSLDLPLADVVNAGTIGGLAEVIIEALRAKYGK
ncbi:hypothetical protein BBP40_008777 [Aspergillus hancockii]|nr:hypothetical protein BBP40_008777 [Aspergillus hancockii]